MDDFLGGTALLWMTGRMELYRLYYWLMNHAAHGGAYENDATKLCQRLWQKHGTPLESPIGTTV